jgi:hypothetical protein
MKFGFLLFLRMEPTLYLRCFRVQCRECVKRPVVIFVMLDFTNRIASYRNW